AQAPTLGTQIIECSQLALARIVPHDTSALWSRHLSPIISGNNRAVIDPRTRSPQLYWTSPFHGDGSDGAIWGYDGHDGLGPAHGGGAVVRSPVEVEEWLIPYRWEKYEFLKDSAGDGQWRGGLGTELHVLNTYDPDLWQSHDCVCMTGNSDGEKFTNTGLLGGTDGIANTLGIIRKGEDVELRCLDNQYLQPGDIVWTKSGGGGGVGDPLDRETDRVLLDARNEYISIKRARDVYGVVIDPDTFELDQEATEKLREELRQKKI
ncbi:MAG: hydantoinase B/oxoprolinase family protein, partial [Deltaproteobacteria bacterium]|nr:hydantoinase B/oxoprolinase family protein [Deltaproteobacteria bacterium]